MNFLIPRINRASDGCVVAATAGKQVLIIGF